MKKFLGVTLIIIAVAAIGGWFYWQQHKKGIIKDTIENAISKGTDSLYFLHYDSSSIDEINGNASFFNVTLQSDSLQRQLQLFDTASSATIFNVHIKEVSILGANIAGLLSNTSIQANSILIKQPVIYLISSGKKEKKSLNSSDSTAIYQKLLGKFKSIKADEIVISNGVLNFTDKTGEPNTALRDINIQLKKFQVDSTRDYQNIISYFVKDIVAKVKEVYIKGDKNKATFTDVEYNAPGKFISLKNFQQKNSDDKIVFDINNTAINNINTDAFILQQQLKAEELISGGGSLTFYSTAKKGADSTSDEINIDNNYFDEAQVNKVSVSNTKITIYSKAKPNNAPLVINNVKFNASEIQKLNSGTSIKNLISNSNWNLSGDGFSSVSENNRYRMNVGAFDMNNGTSTMRIKSFTVKPVLSEAALTKTLPYQQDIYTIELNNIELSGIDTKLLISQKKLEAATATLQPTLKVYHDRTIAEDPTSKVGKYPQQLLQKIKFPFSVKKMIVKNGQVVYTEIGAQSKKAGVVTFKNINGNISNITNMADIISKNNLMTLEASGSFMGLAPMHTTWKLPLNSSNGAFEVAADVGSFNGPSINPMIGALGMAAIKSGHVSKATYNVSGNDLSAKANGTLLYENLKIEILKSDSGEAKKKGFQTLLANALMKNSNPSNSATRTDEATYQRDTTKSFFNLLWKSIFGAIKKTAQKL